ARFARCRAVYGQHPRPIGPSDFFLVGKIVAGNPQRVDPPLRLIVSSNPSDYQLFFGQMAAVDGTGLRFALPTGTYVVRVVNPLYQQVEQQVVIPTSFSPDSPKGSLKVPYLFDLPPAYAYPFPGTCTTSDGRPP